MARDYKDEYKKFQGTKVQLKKRAARNGRRIKLIKKTKGGKMALKGKDIHHYYKGGKLVTQLMSAEKNRGMAGEGGRRKGVPHKSKN